jgi:hypothetical protein
LRAFARISGRDHADSGLRRICDAARQPMQLMNSIDYIL